MPMLPSGRHVAVMPDPLFKLIQSVKEGHEVEPLMAIRKIEDVKNYLDLVELIPVLPDEEPLTKTAPGSTPLPDGMRAEPTGYTLAQYPLAAANWPEEDRVAFEHFLTEARVLTLLDQWFNEARKALDHRVWKNDFSLRVLDSWRAVGVHPDQEDSQDGLTPATHGRRPERS